MKFSAFLIMIGVIALTINCSPIYGVSYDYNRNIDFGHISTYSWLPIPAKTKINSLDIERIRKAVDTALAAKGLSAVTENPDFRIAQYMGSKDRVQIINWGYDYDPYYWRGSRGFRRSSVFQYEEGILILDFVDAQSNNLIWRGEAKGVLSGATNPKKRDRLIQEAVQKILQNFPPP
jgi:hypothetical protein